MCFVLLFFFNDTATTEIYTLSLHDALPIYRLRRSRPLPRLGGRRPARAPRVDVRGLEPPVEDRRRLRRRRARSEEHTSELQSRLHLVCRLLLEKKKHRAPDAYSGHRRYYLH